MESTLQLGEIVAEVVHKSIKNIHLSVYPPHGRVRIAAPLHMNPDSIRAFALTKLGWIQQQQKKMQAQERESHREFLDKESHYLWGERYLLQTKPTCDKPSLQIAGRKLLFSAPASMSLQAKEQFLKHWYKAQIQGPALELIDQWELKLGVKVHQVFFQKMKTRWGSCNPSQRNIRLNIDLAKKPRECLEYIIVHELMHLHEPSHNLRFQALMDQHHPSWHAVRALLAQLPLSHADWTY